MSKKGEYTEEYKKKIQKHSAGGWQGNRQLCADGASTRSSPLWGWLLHSDAQAEGHTEPHIISLSLLQSNLFCTT